MITSLNSCTSALRCLKSLQRSVCTGSVISEADDPDDKLQRSGAGIMQSAEALLQLAATSTAALEADRASSSETRVGSLSHPCDTSGSESTKPFGKASKSLLQMRETHSRPALVPSIALCFQVASQATGAQFAPVYYLAGSKRSNFSLTCSKQNGFPSFKPLARACYHQDTAKTSQVSPGPCACSVSPQAGGCRVIASSDHKRVLQISSRKLAYPACIRLVARSWATAAGREANSQEAFGSRLCCKLLRARD